MHAQGPREQSRAVSALSAVYGGVVRLRRSWYERRPDQRARLPRPVISVAFSGPRKQTLYVVGSGAKDAQGVEHSERTAKTIYKLAMIVAGFGGRPK